MRKGKVYLLLLAGAVLAPVLVVVFSREREPEYGGKRLSEWVMELSPDASYEGGSESERAIRHIGTNAFPYLLRWINYEQPAWRTKLSDFANDPITGKAKLSWMLNDRQEELRYLAARAFFELGRGAEGVIPFLTQTLNNTNALASAQYAALVLADLGEPGLPPLMVVMTNKQSPPVIRSCVLTGFVMQGTNKAPALRALTALLIDADAFSREVATNALQTLDPQTLRTYE